MCTCIGGTRVPATELIGAISTLWECSALIFNGCFWMEISEAFKGREKEVLTFMRLCRWRTQHLGVTALYVQALPSKRIPSTQPILPIPGYLPWPLYDTTASISQQLTTDASTPQQLPHLGHISWVECRTQTQAVNHFHAGPTHIPVSCIPFSSRAVPLPLGIAHGSVFNLKLLPISISKRMKKKNEKPWLLISDLSICCTGREGAGWAAARHVHTYRHQGLGHKVTHHNHFFHAQIVQPDLLK